MRKRQCHRFTKRLEVTFTSEGSRFRGISSDLSAGGLFIRTQHGLTPGSLVDIDVYLPDDKIGHLKGIVKRTIKTALSVIKNGMGVELIERDQNYLEFLRQFDLESQEASVENRGTATAAPNRDQAGADAMETIIIACPKCNVKNRVSVLKLSLGAKCGKCGAVLKITDIS